MDYADVLDVLIKIGVSLLLSGIVGLQRQWQSKPAGLRTHILVCTGSTLITIVSYMYVVFLPEKPINFDPGRIAAQIISGIGFLGAGTILSTRASVRGLTTAASLWAVAGVGMAVGFGLYVPAVITTAVIFITLSFLDRVEKKFISEKGIKTVAIYSKDVPGQIGKLGTILGEQDINVKNMKMEEAESGEIEIYFVLKIPQNVDINMTVERLLKVDGVSKVEVL